MQTMTEVDERPVDRNRWNGTIGGLFGGVDMFLPQDGAFVGKVATAAFGDLRVTRIASTGEDAHRTQAHINRDERRDYLLCFVRDGALLLDQVGRSCTIGPQGFVLFDLGTPHRYRHTSRLDVLSLRIPRPLLQGRLSNVQSYLAQAKQAESGLGLVTRRAVEAVAAEVGQIPESAGAAYVAKLVDLAAITLEARDGDLPDAEPAARFGLYQRALLQIDRRLDDIALSPKMLAQSLGISLRYLHKIFQEHDTSVCDVVLTRRLAKTYDALTSGEAARRSVKEIAFGAGFRSQAHFSAAFRRKYQTTPSDLRRSGRRERDTP